MITLFLKKLSECQCFCGLLCRYGERIFCMFRKCCCVFGDFGFDYFESYISKKSILVYKKTKNGKNNF